MYMRRLKAIGQVAAVVVATFVKVFPLSGILFGLLVILFFAYLSGANDFRSWFRRPKSWRNCVAMALLASFMSMLISYFLLKLFRASPFGGPDYSRFSIVSGNGRLLVIWLVLIWSIVAFGEEIIGRGFLIDELLVACEGTFNPFFLAVVFSAMIFGSVHFYQGVAGMVDNTCTGIIFGTLYLNQRRNLWSNVLSHALIDSIVVVMFYFGACI
jgi:membrane protease YdiL (CAAX protease family)